MERAFGVWQAYFAIIRDPAQYLDKGELGLIMKTGVRLHNMIVENERDLYDLTYDYEPNVRQESSLVLDRLSS